MKHIFIIALFLLVATNVHSEYRDDTLNYRTPGTMWPNEMSATGLPWVIPCGISKDFQAKTVTCTWIKSNRQLTWYDKDRNQNMFAVNRVVGMCRQGVCQSDGDRYGTIPFDTNFILSLWYYIGESTDGKIVAYLQGHGPAYGQHGATYLDAGKTMVEFYAVAGAQQKDIIATMDWRYDGGWAQFLADQDALDNPPTIDITGIKEAWCNPRMDDDCSINGKAVPKAELGKYLPVVDPAEVESQNGTCEYPICYDKDYKPVGIRVSSY